MLLSPEHEERRDSFREFARKHIEPHAADWDRAGALPVELVGEFAAHGYLGALIPARYGGQAFDAVRFGLLNEEIGAACSSARSLLTVHSMVAHSIARWGGEALRERWLPRLAGGTAVGAFALTEEGSGSDAASMAAEAVADGDGYRLTGTKKWITYGQRADVFLVFARCAGGPAAFVVERSAPGVAVEPVDGMLGTRASMVAEVRLADVPVSAEALVGRPGFGIAAVATSALDIGRYSVAWGCVGILAAALRISLAQARDRVRFGAPIADHQLVQRMLADMSTGLAAARLLCLEAGRLKDAGDPRTINATWTAKYFASCQAFRAAADAVQIAGAAGCADGHPAGRLLRDAKVMEIIEGSTQLQQVYLARAAYQDTSAL
ncbi:MAG: acyl-CoA dehydrogenase [Catenulispora sp. 13_1_20CM_3_70_7]|nr:MAG: acyl-CoA dehydrogenase [Catenulispora sp. 13_1_20CM_3_70_7]